MPTRTPWLLAPWRHTPWRCVAAAFVLNGLLLGSWASRVPAVMERHGFGPGQLGLMLLILGLGALVSFPLAGRFSDRLGALRITRWIAAAYVITLMLVGWAPTPLALGVALFLFGMCHGAMDVTMNSWATEVERHIGRSVMSSFHAMWSFGAGAGAVAGGLASWGGLGVAGQFTLVPLLGAALLGPFLAMRWTSPIRERRAGDPLLAVPRGPLVLVGVVALAAGLGEGAVADWSAVFLREALGSSDAHATLGYALFSVAMVVMRLAADPLVNRFGPVRIARASGVAAALGIVLVTGVPSLPAALAGFMLMGVGNAALMPLAFSRAAVDPRIAPGQAIASVATMAYGALLLGPPLIGQIAQMGSLRMALMPLGVIALLVALVAPSLSREGLRAA